MKRPTRCTLQMVGSFFEYFNAGLFSRPETRLAAVYMQRNLPLSLMSWLRHWSACFSEVSLKRLSFFWQDALMVLPSMRMSRQVRAYDPLGNRP